MSARTPSVLQQYRDFPDFNPIDIMDAVNSRLDASPLPFLHQVEVLKHLPRTGWLRMIKTPESVAAHMYRMAIMAMLAPVRFPFLISLCLLT